MATIAACYAVEDYRHNGPPAWEIDGPDVASLKERARARIREAQPADIVRDSGDTLEVYDSSGTTQVGIVTFTSL